MTSTVERKEGGARACACACASSVLVIPAASKCTKDAKNHQSPPLKILIDQSADFKREMQKRKSTPGDRRMQTEADCLSLLSLV
jgi:hypothetical protein